MEKLAGRPFALVGVNSDDSKEKLKGILEKERITWRSFFDGGGTQGPIATAWNVSGWPTIYLIDHEGVIREKNLRDEALAKAIEALVARAEKAPGAER